jgi:hypothetical protein
VQILHVVHSDHSNAGSTCDDKVRGVQHEGHAHTATNTR